MILTSNAIQKAVASGDITISPFNINQLGTISYRFRLSNIIRKIESDIDSKTPVDFSETVIPEKGFILKPSSLYLVNTFETLGSRKYAQQIFGLKDIGSMGIFINISANLGHVGAITPWTLEITVAQPVIVYPKQFIGQIIFWYLLGETELYNGEYQGMTEPLTTKFWKEELSK